MNKKKTSISFLILYFAMISASLSCDICGCSVGGNYFGILPKFQNNFIGVRYQYRSFDSEHLILFPGDVPMKTHETFHTAELWGRYVVNRKLHLFAFLPYNYYIRDENETRSVVSGVGDISLMASYIVINTGNELSSNWKHALQIGAGIKLPTGKSNSIEPHSGLLIPSLQVGTGSFDLPFNLIYTLRYNQVGLNVEANYRMNTSNKRKYKFGDRITSSARIFYWKKIKNTSFLPHLGMSFEYGFIDQDKKVKQEYTQSNVLMGNVGIDVYYRKMILNLSTQMPLYQDIAQGQIVSKQRLYAGVSFLF